MASRCDVLGQRGGAGGYLPFFLRFWGVLQSELLDRGLFPTPEAADEALTRFAMYHDYHRLGGAIGWQTLAERWDGTPFTDQGFEHIPALEHLQGWRTERLAA